MKHAAVHEKVSNEGKESIFIPYYDKQTVDKHKTKQKQCLSLKH